MARLNDVVAYFHGQAPEVGMVELRWLVFHAWGLHWATSGGDLLFSEPLIWGGPGRPPLLGGRWTANILADIAEGDGSAEALSSDERRLCEVVWEETGEWDAEAHLDYVRRGAADLHGDTAQRQYMAALLNTTDEVRLPRLPRLAGWEAEAASMRGFGVRGVLIVLGLGALATTAVVYALGFVEPAWLRYVLGPLAGWLLGWGVVLAASRFLEDE